MIYTTALLDACVLYPQKLRDLFMWLAVEDLYRARWTDHIHDEWIRNYSADHPDQAAGTRATRALMNESIPECLITGYEPLIETVSLPDPDDRHVLAAAIVGKVDVIITFNLGDFPAERLYPYRVSAVSPDDFLLELIYADTASVCRAVRKHRAVRRNPPRTVDDILGWMARAGLPDSAGMLRNYRDQL
jgi:predicted nucleic acid-binding protein